MHNSGRNDAAIVSLSDNGYGCIERCERCGDWTGSRVRRDNKLTGPRNRSVVVKENDAFFRSRTNALEMIERRGCSWRAQCLGCLRGKPLELIAQRASQLREREFARLLLVTAGGARLTTIR